MALDDAFCLAESLAVAPSVAHALAAYESKRLAKTSDIVKLSKVLGSINNMESSLLCGLRNSLLGLCVRSGAMGTALANEINKDAVIPLGRQGGRA